MSTQETLRKSIREEVAAHLNAAETTNNRKFIQGDSTATSEYIYENQKEDSQKIITEFKRGKRVVSVQKRTKVGADGLMICVLIDMAMEGGELFTDPKNVRILTGMSNCEWEKAMIEKSPMCYKDKIFHHGQLPKANLKNLKNALIIIDEIDSGDKENQVLHKTLKDSGVLNIKFMSENNIRFIFISATIIRELHDLYHWGNLHESITMSVPSSYIGHGDFLKRGIIQEFYPMNSIRKAEQWIEEDILPYKHDYRVHIVRTTEDTVQNVQDACIKKEIEFRDHNAFERLSFNELKKIFEDPLTNHIVICVKRFYRRANLIPNKWKLRIGATHEYHVDKVDNNVQIQGLPGRMTGYWREIIESGHKTGPYRTSIDAIKEYESVFIDPFGDNPYQLSGFKKNSRGKISQTSFTFLNPRHIENLDALESEESEEPKKHEEQHDISGPFDDHKIATKWCLDNLYGDYAFSWYIPCNEDRTRNLISGTHIKPHTGNYAKQSSQTRRPLIKILNEKETRDLKSISHGVTQESGKARIRPVLDEKTSSLKYIVVFDKTKKIK